MSRFSRALAILFEVISSGVGPSPPVTTITRARTMARVTASAIASSSSPTVVMNEGITPAVIRRPAT